MYIVANEKRGFIEIGELIMTDVDKADVKEYEYRRRIIELETEKNLEKQKVMQMKLQYQQLENQCHYLEELIALQDAKLNSKGWKALEKMRKVVYCCRHFSKPKKVTLSQEQVLKSDIDKKDEPKPKKGKPYRSHYEEDQDFSKYHTDIKTLAFYLPQYHTFPENDEWWGKGFTEWVNTRKAKPLFPGHYQPREPHDDIGYYTLDNKETLKRQIDLAKRHGIYGFAFYYYWFSGKRLMEKPVNIFLENKDLDFPFLFCWANENWTRAWDGSQHDIIMKQEYKKDDYRAFIRDIKKYLMDERYIRIDGKPIIMIYNIAEIPNLEELVNAWRVCAREEGIGEILVWIRYPMQKNEHEFAGIVDAEFDFAPHYFAGVENHIDDLPSKEVYDYEKIVDQAIERYQPHFPIIPFYYSCTMGWDNTSRRKVNPMIFYGYSPKKFYDWVRTIVKFTRKRHREEDRFIFVNAWNEWAEGTYLEPDKKYGYTNINTLSKAIFDLPYQERKTKKKD